MKTARCVKNETCFTQGMSDKRLWYQEQCTVPKLGPSKMRKGEAKCEEQHVVVCRLTH